MTAAACMSPRYVPYLKVRSNQDNSSQVKSSHVKSGASCIRSSCKRVNTAAERWIGAKLTPTCFETPRSNFLLRRQQTVFLRHLGQRRWRCCTHSSTRRTLGESMCARCTHQSLLLDRGCLAQSPRQRQRVRSWGPVSSRDDATRPTRAPRGAREQRQRKTKCDCICIGSVHC